MRAWGTASTGPALCWCSMSMQARLLAVAAATAHHGCLDCTKLKLCVPDTSIEIACQWSKFGCMLRIAHQLFARGMQKLEVELHCMTVSLTQRRIPAQDGLARRHIKACTHMPSNYDTHLIGKAPSGAEGKNKSNLSCVLSLAPATLYVISAPQYEKLFVFNAKFNYVVLYQYTCFGPVSIRHSRTAHVNTDLSK